MTGHHRDWPQAAIATLIGLVIIACSIESGIHRWADPAWYYASLVPGSPMSWGVVMLTAGLLIAGGTRWPRLLKAGYVLAFAWFCFMCAAATLSAGHDLVAGTREADPVDMVTWGALAFWCRVSFPRGR